MDEWMNGWPPDIHPPIHPSIHPPLLVCGLGLPKRILGGRGGVKRGGDEARGASGGSGEQRRRTQPRMTRMGTDEGIELGGRRPPSIVIVPRPRTPRAEDRPRIPRIHANGPTRDARPIASHRDRRGHRPNPPNPEHPTPNTKPLPPASAPASPMPTTSPKSPSRMPPNSPLRSNLRPPEGAKRGYLAFSGRNKAILPNLRPPEKGASWATRPSGAVSRPSVQLAPLRAHAVPSACPMPSAT